MQEHTHIHDIHAHTEQEMNVDGSNNDDVCTWMQTEETYDQLCFLLKLFAWGLKIPCRKGFIDPLATDIPYSFLF